MNIKNWYKNILNLTSSITIYNFLEYIFLVFILVTFVFSAFDFYYNFFYSSLYFPIRVLGLTVLGIATFGLLSKKNFRVRVLVALGGILSQIVYNTAVENPIGFNKLNSNNLFPDFNLSEWITLFIDVTFKQIMQLVVPVYVEGHLDDLIGQRMFIEVILFFMSILTLCLFIAFIFSLIIYLNKDRIINKFQNKFVIFVIKYEIFLSKLTLFYIPFFIILSLLTLCQGHLWLITHQIPYLALDIDLHQFISSSK